MKFDVVLIHPLKRGEVRGTMVRRSVELSTTDGDTLERSLCELASREVASGDSRDSDVSGYTPRNAVPLSERTDSSGAKGAPTHTNACPRATGWFLGRWSWSTPTERTI